MPEPALLHTPRGWLDIAEMLAAGAEAVDRGTRNLAPELALLAQQGLLAEPARPVGPDGRWLAAGAGEWLADTLVALGRVSLPLARLYEGHVDALGLIWNHGNDQMRRRGICFASAGQLLGVWGADDPQAPVVCEPAARGGHTLRGRKLFASGLGLVQRAIVTARNPAGALCLFMVDASDPARQDATAWDMGGMVGSASGGYMFEGLHVADEDQIGPAGVLFTEPHFHGGLWRICAIQAGALAGIAEHLAAHLRQRGQDNDALQRQRLAQLVLAAETARLWADSAALAVAAPFAPASAIERPLLAREAIDRMAMAGLDACERAAGTTLHSRSSAMGRMVRDLRLYLRQASLDAKLDTALGLWWDALDAGRR